MAGQTSWGNAGDTNNAYPVRFNLETELYYYAVSKNVFGGMNEGREVKVIKKTFGMNTVQIDAGNDSPVWEKGITTGNETRFTTVEETTGNPTYGNANPSKGDFDQYQHSVVYTRNVNSPAYPVVGLEDKEQVKELIKDLVSQKKSGITRWAGRQMDLDGFRAIFCGASRGLLASSGGGLNIALYGATAGQTRSPYNITVGGAGNEGVLVTPSATRATHETNVNTALDTLSNTAGDYFGYAEHKGNSYLIDSLDFKPVRIGGREYRAVAICEPAAMDRLIADTTLLGLLEYATPRAEDNRAIYRQKALVLDDILYFAARQLEFFRPTPSGTDVNLWGASIVDDPYVSGYTNSSKIRPVVYMGAGALLRGRNKKLWWTEKVEEHTMDAEYSLHYRDGWMRQDRFTKDGRTQLKNDNLLVGAYWDEGVGVTPGS